MALPPRSRTVRLSVETLEDRVTPALFGLPWPDASHLTVSFAPDNTTIPGGNSDLFASLDAKLGRTVWQNAVLRAMQTWAVQANVNFGLVGDGGQAFGVSGAAEGDTRFGDVRIGGHAMTDEAFAVSVPYDPFLSGTWAGDLLVNTNATLDEATLYHVALHETGHVLGIGPSDDPTSVMYNRLGTVTTLSAADIAAVQRLYGARQPDVNEGSTGNETFANATRIQAPSRGESGTFPVVLFGDVTTKADTDTYVLKPIDGYVGPVTFNLRAAGLSLLNASLTAYDAAGNVVATAKASGPGGDVSLTLPNVDPLSKFFVRVRGATDDVFGVGRYALVTSFDTRNTISPQQITDLLRTAPSSLMLADVDNIFRSGSDLWSDDKGTNDKASGAQQLNPVVSPTGEARFDAVGSISKPNEVDFYRVKLPKPGDAVPEVLTVTLRAGGVNGVVPTVQLLDSQQRPIAFEVLVNGNGSLTVQSTAVRAGEEYLVRVSGTQAGNYVFSATSGLKVLPRTNFASGTLDTPTKAYTVFVAETQLFAFTLAAKGTSGGVTVEIRNEAGQLVLSLAAKAGETISANGLLLPPGAYQVQIIRQPGGTGPLTYSLFGGSLSDPIGPALSDPTLTPQYMSPTDPSTFLYPGAYQTQVPFLWVIMDPAGPLVLPGRGTGFPVNPTLSPI